MLDRRKWPLIVRILVDQRVDETGRAQSRLTKSDWIEIACKAAREPGLIERALISASHSKLPAHSKVAAPTHATKKRGRPVKWSREKARRYLEDFEDLRKRLGDGERLSDLETARRLVKRDMPNLRGNKQLLRARALAKDLAYFRKIAKS
jgi:hypothetical protein